MPKPPPHDQEGAIQPHDHDEIANHHRVIRRISERQVVVDKSGVRRISSIAYQPSRIPSGGMSVDIQHFIELDGRNAREWVTSPRWIGSVSFQVGYLRDNGFQVGFHPISESADVPENPYHGEVWGEFSRDQKARLQQAAEWFVEIEGVVLT